MTWKFYMVSPNSHAEVKEAKRNLRIMCALAEIQTGHKLEALPFELICSVTVRLLFYSIPVSPTWSIGYPSKARFTLVS
jgi:hypothetical protein